MRMLASSGTASPLLSRVYLPVPVDELNIAAYAAILGPQVDLSVKLSLTMTDSSSGLIWTLPTPQGGADLGYKTLALLPGKAKTSAPRGQGTVKGRGRCAVSHWACRSAIYEDILAVSCEGLDPLDQVHGEQKVIMNLTQVKAYGQIFLYYLYILVGDTPYIRLKDLSSMMEKNLLAAASVEPSSCR